MVIAEKLDDYGKPAWIAAMIVGFVIFWPIGLGILGYMIWSGRMGYWKGPGRRHSGDADDGRSGSRWRHRCGRHNKGPATDNRAFNEYREETLRRLEDERSEFEDFLENLRHAKDKAEFDQFMAAQRNRDPGDGEGSEDAAKQPTG